MNLLTKSVAAAVIAGGISSLGSSADAVPLGASLALRDATTPMSQPVQWRRGWGGVGFGLAAAAIIGGAIAASSYRYGYGYPAYGYGYPAYSYGYGYPAYSYRYAPAYSYGYGYGPAYYGYAPAYYGYRYAYPRYRTGIYVRRAWRRW